MRMNRAAAAGNPGTRQPNRAAAAGNPRARQQTGRPRAQPRRPPTKPDSRNRNPATPPSFPRKRESRNFTANNRSPAPDTVDSHIPVNDKNAGSHSRQPKPNPTPETYI